MLLSLSETKMSISSVTSEALQLKLRQLLPSQQGFGTDLSASDTIIPVIDLTASAEGSDVRPDLQTALSFGNITNAGANNATVTIVNTAGFYRLVGNTMIASRAGTAGQCSIALFDGTTTKNLRFWFAVGYSSGTETTTYNPFDFIVYLNSGESVTATANAQSIVNVTSYQIADVNGVLVQPSGFTPQ
jgi:hypothetical protein